LLCFLDATGEALAGILRPGNAGSNTAADHITVLELALAQIPDAHRYGTDILIRSDSAGASKAFLAHIRGLREHAMRSRFSIGNYSGRGGSQGLLVAALRSAVRVPPLSLATPPAGLGTESMSGTPEVMPRGVWPERLR
jgi:hypothetical protein